MIFKKIKTKNEDHFIPDFFKKNYFDLMLILLINILSLYNFFYYQYYFLINIAFNK